MGPIAVIARNRPERRNRFDGEMDLPPSPILAELQERRDVRGAVWRTEGPVRSAGRDVSVIAKPTTSRCTTHDMVLVPLDGGRAKEKPEARVSDYYCIEHT
jgi:enoyl-CoA hydratase/carnithine racemase